VCNYRVALPESQQCNCNSFSSLRRKNYAGSESHSSLRIRSHFGTGYRETPPPPEKKKTANEDQDGCRHDLKPALDES
jgi:hypothetical protein